MSMSVAELLNSDKEDIPKIETKPDELGFPSPEKVYNSGINKYLKIVESKSATADKEIEEFIAELEKGRILTDDDGTHVDLQIANDLLSGIIQMQHELKNPIDYDTEADTEAFIMEVKEAIRLYADNMLYDSCIMWCEALEWDKKMCEPIIKGSPDFFLQMESLGYPRLCLLVKAAKK